MSTQIVARILIKVWLLLASLLLYHFVVLWINIPTVVVFSMNHICPAQALMAMPGPDFSLCLFLIPERVVLFFSDSSSQMNVRDLLLRSHSH